MLCAHKFRDRSHVQIRKVHIAPELMAEANDKEWKIEDKLAYVAERMGCCKQRVRDEARKTGFKWTPKVNRNMTTTMRSKIREDACWICGEDRLIEVAHIIPKAEGGKARLDNLMPLCPTHHRLYDHNKLYEEESLVLEHKFSFLFKHMNHGLEGIN